MTTPVDVLVVGTGPVGLMMASELRRHGVNCRIIDKLPTPVQYCKAIGVQPRTLEIWEDLGIATEMINCRHLAAGAAGLCQRRGDNADGSGSSRYSL